MAILGDEEKRAVYDQTGCVDDAVSIFQDFSISQEISNFMAFESSVVLGN